MKKQLISNALSQIDDEYIEEAENYKSKKKLYKYFFLPAAACLCLILGVKFKDYITLQADVADNTSVEIVDYIILNKAPEEHKDYSYGIDLPKVYTEIDPYAEISYYPYIEFENRMYGLYSTVDNASELLGDKLGYSVGCFDKNGNPTGSNSTIVGDFFAVNGYDTDFMICKISDGNQLSLFINDNGFRISYGEQIFDKQLHVSERYESISFQTRDKWYYGQDSSMLSSELYSSIDSFLELINQAKWIFSESSIGNKTEDYHLYFHLKDGITVQLRLYKDGYVEFDGINGACLQIDKTAMQELFLLFES